jgi:hypothetical protein
MSVTVAIGPFFIGTLYLFIDLGLLIELRMSNQDQAERPDMLVRRYPYATVSEVPLSSHLDLALKRALLLISQTRALTPEEVM